MATPHRQGPLTQKEDLVAGLWSQSFVEGVQTTKTKPKPTAPRPRSPLTEHVPIFALSVIEKVVAPKPKPQPRRQGPLTQKEDLMAGLWSRSFVEGVQTTKPTPVAAQRKPPKRVPASYLHRIQEFSVDEKEDHSTEISWKLLFMEATAGAGVFSPEVDDPLVKEGTELELRFGWLGQLSRKHTVIVTSIEPSFDANGIGHVVKCRDLTTKMQGKESQRSFSGKTKGDVIGELAKANGLTAMTPGPSGKLVPLNAANTPEALKKKSNLVQAKKNDHDFIGELLSTTEYKMHVDGKNLIVAKQDYAKAAEIDYVWRDGRGALLSFKPVSKTTTKKGGAANETKSVGTNRGSKEKIEAKANEDTEKGRPVLGKGLFNTNAVTGQEKWKAETSGKIISHPSSDKAVHKEAAKAHRADGEKSPIQANAEVYGAPLLERGAVIRIIGVGRKNSGAWKVVTVKHKIGTAGFQTSLSLHRHGHNSAGKNDPKTKGKVNESKPGAPQRRPGYNVNVISGAETKGSFLFK